VDRGAIWTTIADGGTIGVSVVMTGAIGVRAEIAAIAAGIVAAIGMTTGAIIVRAVVASSSKSVRDPGYGYDGFR
jgi:hypothetical protein